MTIHTMPEIRAAREPADRAFYIDVVERRIQDCLRFYPWPALVESLRQDLRILYGRE